MGGVLAVVVAKTHLAKHTHAQGVSMKAGDYRLIPKGNGKMRKILVTTARFRNENRKLVPLMHRLQQMACDTNPGPVVHGFYLGRSPVTNAMRHIGFQYSVCFDLENFFPSVTRAMFDKALTWLPSEHRPERDITVRNRMRVMFVDDKANASHGHEAIAEQGIPTSPMVANIAASPLDRKLVVLGSKAGEYQFPITYTRYADDLTFSFNDPAFIDMLLTEVPQLVAAAGFKVNERKTHVQRAKQGRRIITGIGVDDTGIHPTREVKRRLRAALHNGWCRKAAGLAEWCKLKLPFDQPERAYALDYATKAMAKIAAGGIGPENAKWHCKAQRDMSPCERWRAAWDEAERLIAAMV